MERLQTNLLGHLMYLGQEDLEVMDHQVVMDLLKDPLEDMVRHRAL
jgi:hypothetical protein